MSLLEFYKLLQGHDWTYMMSDSFSVHQRGEERHRKLKALANTSKKHKKLFDDYHASIWSGDHMGTEQLPKPKQPAADEGYTDEN